MISSQLSRSKKGVTRFHKGQTFVLAYCQTHAWHLYLIVEVNVHSDRSRSIERYAPLRWQIKAV